MRPSCSPGVGSQQPSAMPQLAGQGLTSQGLSCHQQRGRGGWGPRGQWPGPFRPLMPSRPWHVELHVGRLEAFHSKLDQLLSGRAHHWPSFGAEEETGWLLGLPSLFWHLKFDAISLHYWTPAVACGDIPWESQASGRHALVRMERCHSRALKSPASKSKTHLPCFWGKYMRDW